MKLFKIILFSLCFVSFSTFAQNDTDAAKLLETVSSKYKKYKSSKIEVKLIIDVPEIDKDVVRNGTAWLKGDKFKIDFEEKMLVSNTISHWTYLKEVNELQISNYDESSMIFLPSKIFNLYSDDYIYRVSEEYKNDKGELIKKIELSPKNKNYEIFKIVVSINVNKLKLIETQMFEKSGYRYAYKILNLETNIELDDNFFIFNPADYNIDEDDITDLR